MNIVLFLGAGFSARFGLPTMNQFFQSVQASSRLKPEEKQSFADVILEARNANSFVRSTATNLEDVLSFAAIADRTRVGDDSPRMPLVRRVLHQIYAAIPGPYPCPRGLQAPNFYSHYDALPVLLGPWWGPEFFEFNRLSVITTNYDVLAECALKCQFRRINVGFNPIPVDSKPPVETLGYYSDGDIPLMKLHGSVNWYMVDNKLQVEQRFGPYECAESLPVCCASSFSPPGDVFILPPTYSKAVPQNGDTVMREIWSIAARALRDAHLLMFVGYSFPPSDTEMRFFLGASLSGNAWLQRIAVVDPNATKTVARLRDSASGYGSQFVDLLDDVPYDWEKSSAGLTKLFLSLRAPEQYQ